MRPFAFAFVALVGSALAADPAPPSIDRRRAEAMRALREADPAKRNRAAFVLHRVGASVADLPELIRLLKDDKVDDDVKSEIARALARLGPAAAPACDALLDGNSAFAAVVAIGPAAVEPIRRRLRACIAEPDKEGVEIVAHGLVDMLRRIGAPAALRAEPELRALQRFDVLAHLGDPKAPADLAAWLVSADSKYDKFPIGRVDPVAFAEALAAQYRNFREPVAVNFPDWSNSIMEMAKLGSAAVPQLRRLLDPKESALTRVAALRTVELMGPAARPAIEELIRNLRSRDKIRVTEDSSADSAVRAYALRALAALGPGAVDALPDIIDCLDDPDVFIGASAIRTLECLGPAAVDALAALRKILADPKGRNRGLAPRAALAIWNIERNPEPLFALALIPDIAIVDESPWTDNDAEKRILAEAVRRKPSALADAPLAKTMLMWLPDIARRLDPVPPAVQHYAVRGLKAPWPAAVARAVQTLEILGPQAVRAQADQLLELARRPIDKDPGATDAAIAALVRLGDPRALPLLEKRLSGDKVDASVQRLAIACGPVTHPYMARLLGKGESRLPFNDVNTLIHGLGAVAVVSLLADDGGCEEVNRRLKEIGDVRQGLIIHGDWLLRQWLVGRDESLRSAVDRLRLRLAVDDDSVALLIRDLASPDAFRRTLAADLLSTVGPRGKPAVSALVKALTDADRQVALSALRALTAIGEPAPEAGPLLLKWLDDIEGGRSGVAALALPVLAPRLPGLADRLLDANSRLAVSDLPATVPLQDRHFVRLAELKCDEVLIARAGEARAALPKLIERFRTSEPHVAPVLTAIAGKSAVPVLIEGLDSPVYMDRVQAARALGSLGTDAEPAVAALQALLDDPVDWLPAMDALSRIRPSAATAALPRLLKELDLGEDWGEIDTTSVDYIELLGRLGPASAPAVEVLTRRLRDVRWRLFVGGFYDVVNVRAQVFAIRALSSIGREAAPAVPVIAGLLEAEVAELRVEAALALMRLGADRTRAVEVLREVARGRFRRQLRQAFPYPPKPEDCVRAIRALVELRDPQAAAILIAIVENDTPFIPSVNDHEEWNRYRLNEPWRWWNGSVCEAAVEGLGKLGAVEAVEVLRRHAANPRSPIRSQAQQVLTAMRR